MIRERIRDYVTTNFSVDGGALRDDESLLDRGIIDSTGVLELIQFIEREYSVRVGASEIVPENLDSIARVEKFVERKLAQGDRERAERASPP